MSKGESGEPVERAAAEDGRGESGVGERSFDSDRVSESEVEARIIRESARVRDRGGKVHSSRSAIRIWMCWTSKRKRPPGGPSGSDRGALRAAATPLAMLSGVGRPWPSSEGLALLAEGFDAVPPPPATSRLVERPRFLTAPQEALRARSRSGTESLRCNVPGVFEGERAGVVSGGGGDRGEVGVSIFEGSEASTSPVTAEVGSINASARSRRAEKTRAPVSFSSGRMSRIHTGVARSMEIRRVTPSRRHSFVRRASSSRDALRERGRRRWLGGSGVSVVALGATASNLSRNEGCCCNGS